MKDYTKFLLFLIDRDALVISFWTLRYMCGSNTTMYYSVPIFIFALFIWVLVYSMIYFTIRFIRPQLLESVIFSTCEKHKEVEEENDKR